MFLKDRFIRNILKRVIKDREDNLVRLKFDLAHNWKLWEDSQDRRKELQGEKLKLEEELNINRQMGGKSEKTVKKIAESEMQLNKVIKELQGLILFRQKAEEALGYIPETIEMIGYLKECINNPNIIKEIYEQVKENKVNFK